MPDYKEMYFTLFRETRKAISILQKAQQLTEEMYIAGSRESNPAATGPDETDNNAKQPLQE